MLRKERRSAGSLSPPKLVSSFDKVLLEPAEKVPDNMDVDQLVEDMLNLLHDSETGLAVAAPQIGVSLRVIVVRIRSTRLRPGLKESKPLVFINPEVELLGKCQEKKEGCISILGLRGRVPRHDKVRVRYQTQSRPRRQRGVTLRGLRAQIMQHEVDHLDGCLYVMYGNSATLEEVD